MNFFIKNKNFFLLVIGILILITSYSFYLINYGFGSGDQLAEILISLEDKNSLLDRIKAQIVKPSFMDRPVSTSVVASIYYFFEDTPILYSITTLIVWLLTVAIISFSLNRFLDKNNTIIFFLISAFPFFASSIFFETYFIGTYIGCIFFWSISLFFIVKFSEEKKFYLYILSLFFLLLSILTLEYLIVLLLLNIFLPIINEIDKKNEKLNKEKIYQFILTYFLPNFFICIIYFLYKIYFTTGENVYGLSVSIKSLLQALYYYFVIFFETPILLFESIKFIINLKAILILILISIFYFLLSLDSTNKNNKNNKNKKKKKYFLIIILCSLFISSVIFFLSSYPATTFGYYNRMMLPSFVLYAILVSTLFGYLNSSRVKIVFFIMLSFLWIYSTVIQLDNFVYSWQKRDLIAKDISSRLKVNSISKNTVLIANVPFFLNNNFNNEPVFLTTWDFAAHIQYHSQIRIDSWPINHRILNDKNFYPTQNILNHQQKLKNKNFIYYEYNDKNQKINYEIISNFADLNNKLLILKEKNINQTDIIFRERIRIYLINFFKNLN